jgi:hypothetical protein
MLSLPPFARRIASGGGLVMRGNGRIRGFLGGLALAALATMGGQQDISTQADASKMSAALQKNVTGYNTVPAQTSATPCISASGDNICGRTDTVACPSILPMGSVEIRGAKYVCNDRLAKKYRGRFDINCDKDAECPYRVTGWTTVKLVPE